MKRCKTCKELKPLTEFSVRNSKNPNGRRAHCKQCRNKEWSDYNKEHKEEIRANNFKHYLKKKFNFERKYNNAKSRFGDKFILTYDEYIKILGEVPTCYYCEQPYFSSGTGLDRIDNTKWYEVGNVLPCCWDCNKHRQNSWTVDEAKIAIVAVINYRKKSNV